MRVSQHRVIGTLTAVLQISCASPGGPSALAPGDVSGNYVLTSINGVSIGTAAGPVSGTVQLYELGAAERRIVHRAPDGSRSTHTLVGSYVLKGHRLRLTLLDGTYAWRPTTRIEGGALTLTYGSLNDGADIVERYEPP